MIDEIKELSSKHDIYIPQNFLDALNDIEIERLLYTLRELDKKSWDICAISHITLLLLNGNRIIHRKLNYM